MTPRPACVYRFFDADDKLLYVGQTTNWGARFTGHAGDKPWWTEVVRIELDHFEDDQAAAIAEAQAILDENPLHNRLRRQPRVYAVPGPDDELDSASYRIDFHCANCGAENDRLPKGTLLSDHRCRNCEVPGTLVAGALAA